MLMSVEDLIESLTYWHISSQWTSESVVPISKYKQALVSVCEAILAEG